MPDQDPLDALAQQYVGQSGDPLDALAQSYVRPPDFRITNEPPPASWGEAAKNAVSTAGTVAGNVAYGFGESTIGGMYGLLKDAITNYDWRMTPAGNALAFVVRTGIKVGQASLAQITQGMQLAEKYARTGDLKDWMEASGHLAAALPLIGPAAAQAGELIGTGDTAKVSQGVGQALGLVGPAALLASGKTPSALRLRSPVPEEAAAVDWGLAPDPLTGQPRVPVDVATATGSSVASGTRFLASKLPGSAGIVKQGMQNIGEALEAQGRQLGEQTRPGGPVSPYEAGGAIGAGLRGQVAALKPQINRAYGFVDEAAQLPENIEQVPRPFTPQELAQQEAAARRLAPRQRASLGDVPTPDELRELRRIRQEMQDFPFRKDTWVDAPDRRGNFAGGQSDVFKGGAGAEVYNDILEGLGARKSAPSRGTVTDSIDNAIRTGHFDKIAQAAYDVAQRRLAGDPTLRRAELPPEAGDLPQPIGDMALPIHMAPVKAQLQPIYTQLVEANRVAPLMGGKAGALRAVARVVNGPDYVPLTVADKALSDLKALARTNLPELRTESQGIALKAVSALSDAIDAKAATSAGDVGSALSVGRALTREKYEVGDLLKQTRAEPVQAYKQLVKPGDAGFDRLNAIVKTTPDLAPMLGRAWLDERLALATREGGFGHTARLFKDWRDLGPQTKALLFPADVRAALDQFFQLAKKYDINPNTSGTSGVIAQMEAGQYLVRHPVKGTIAILNGRQIARMLFSPGLARKLTQGITLPLKSAAAAALADDLAAAGRTASLPTAAENREESAPFQGLRTSR